MRPALRSALLVAALAVAASGCYKSTIHLADGPTTPSPVQDQLHVNLINVVEVSAPVDLRAACPGGAATIREQVGVFGGLVNIVLGTYLPILSVMNPSVDCVSGR